jgi:hypothetical protein
MPSRAGSPASAGRPQYHPTEYSNAVYLAPPAPSERRGAGVVTTNLSGISQIRRTKSEELFGANGNAAENLTPLASPDNNFRHYYTSNTNTHLSILPNDLPHIVTPGQLSVSPKARSAPPISSRPVTPKLPWSRRHRILFYHKHDPHYGFTNFSPHPVQYLGKRFPTSEHLFQSFKVCHCSLCEQSAKLIVYVSLKVIRSWWSASERALRDQAKHSPRHAASVAMCALIGGM